MIELSDMIDEKLKVTSSTPIKAPSLSSQLLTSAAIQTEMAPGTRAF